jgi:hypothetical protein
MHTAQREQPVAQRRTSDVVAAIAVSSNVFVQMKNNFIMNVGHHANNHVTLLTNLLRAANRNVYVAVSVLLAL